MAQFLHYKNCLLKTVDFVKGKIITNFPISKTGKGLIFLTRRSFFKKKVCTNVPDNLYAICTLLPCVCFSMPPFFVNFETFFRRFLLFLRFQILKDSQFLRLIRYEKPQNGPDFFMLK